MLQSVAIATSLVIGLTTVLVSVYFSQTYYAAYLSMRAASEGMETGQTHLVTGLYRGGFFFGLLLFLLGSLLVAYAAQSLLAPGPSLGPTFVFTVALLTGLTSALAWSRARDVRRRLS